MIQILTHDGKADGFLGDNYCIRSFHEMSSFDSNDINYIDLNNESIWRNKDSSFNSINDINNMKSLGTIINECKSSVIIIRIPDNHKCYFHYYQKKYYEYVELKDIIPTVAVSILQVLYPPLGKLQLIYEKDITTIKQSELKSDFWIKANQDQILLKSDSGKAVVVQYPKVLITTLNIQGSEQLEDLLEKLGLLHKKLAVPDWIKNYHMFDDKKQLGIIKDNKELIKKATMCINIAQEVLDANEKLKSILYTNGQDLVDQVFLILQELIGCDLSQFIDQKKEDFYFEIGGRIFIGEIKGVTSNVRSEYISQLDVHFQSYMDDHPGVKPESIIALLIINHQRNKPIDLREPIHENQIQLATRNKSLIIETSTLLKLLEQYRAAKLSQEECIELFAKNTGLFELTVTG